MLGLQLPTEPTWAWRAQENLPEVLTDHAYCEQKAASNAISLVLAYPELSDLVAQMGRLAQEEMDHFTRVHALICARGWTLGPVRRDEYVNELYAYQRKGSDRREQLMERLFFAAMVEARSCERFRLLADAVRQTDPELAAFYHELMASEAGHYTTFLKLARQYAPAGYDVQARWQQWLAHEAEVCGRYVRAQRMHG